MPSVYIETSVVSHASARPYNDPITRALQIQARRWWDNERHAFDLYTSQAVIDEAPLGDPEAAAERLELLRGLPLVDISEEVRRVAAEILAHSLMPQKAAADALHVAAAAVAGVDYDSRHPTGTDCSCQCEFMSVIGGAAEFTYRADDSLDFPRIA